MMYYLKGIKTAMLSIVLLDEKSFLHHQSETLKLPLKHKSSNSVWGVQYVMYTANASASPPKSLCVRNWLVNFIAF